MSEQNSDPFQHHPQLREFVTDPLQSTLREVDLALLDQHMAAMGRGPDWRHSNETRERLRRDALAGHQDEDLWIFGYGSLIWDPAIVFAEVRIGHIDGYARRFCVKDILGSRGTPEVPGLVAALDTGPGCDGLTFRIPEAQIEQETERLWRREMLLPGYLPVFVDVETALGVVSALTFVADHTVDVICPDISRAQQVHYLATGTGFLGSSLQYIEQLASRFAAIQIEDPELLSLLEEARQAAAEHNQ